VPPQITKTPQARRDLLEIAGYIARDNFDAALRFLDAAEAAFELLARSPEMAARCHFRAPEAAGLRVWSIKGFENYCILYRPIPGGIDVIRVLHGGRDIETMLSETR
jgi:toxin ParE1/3/4